MRWKNQNIHNFTQIDRLLIFVLVAQNIVKLEALKKLNDFSIYICSDMKRYNNKLYQTYTLFFKYRQYIDNTVLFFIVFITSEVSS